MALDPRSLARWGPLLAAGTELAACVVAGVIAGYYLDRYFGSAPWLTLLCTLGGLVGGMSRLLWVLKRWQTRQTSEDDTSSTSGD